MLLTGCLCNIEVTFKFRHKCLILGVYTCFYEVGNWHKEAFQAFEEEFPTLCSFFLRVRFPTFSDWNYTSGSRRVDTSKIEMPIEYISNNNIIYSLVCLQCGFRCATSVLFWCHSVVIEYCVSVFVTYRLIKSTALWLFLTARSFPVNLLTL